LASLNNFDLRMTIDECCGWSATQPRSGITSNGRDETRCFGECEFFLRAEPRDEQKADQSSGNGRPR
jgi:hypothetical protein